MTRGRFFRQYRIFPGPMIGPIFLSMLVGSLFGAFCACLQNRGLQPFQTGPQGNGDLLQILLRCARFPALLTAALLLRRRFLFYFLFFLKGALISFVLCTLAVSGIADYPAILFRVFCECVVPLPALLYLGSAWSSEPDCPRPDLWPLFSALLLTCFGIFLEILFLK